MMHRKVKHRAFIHFPLCPNAPAMTLNHPLNDSQTNSGAIEFPTAIQALEHTKQIIHIAHIKTGAAAFTNPASARAFPGSKEDGKFAISIAANRKPAKLTNLKRHPGPLNFTRTRITLNQLTDNNNLNKQHEYH